MKILADDKNTIVFLSNYIPKENQTILKVIQKLNIDGYINVKADIDKTVGTILEINKEEFEFSFPLDLEVNIIKLDDEFIFEIEDFNYVDEEFYKYKDKFYLKKINLQKLEFAKLIYGKKALEIKKRWKKYEKKSSRISWQT